MTDAPATTPRSASTAQRAIAWALVLVWASVIFWFSAKPGSQIPGRFAEVGHFGEYFIFGVLLFWALRGSVSRSQAVWIAIIVASCYGVTDEFHQHFVVMRTPDIADWGMDTVGATTGALVASLVDWRLARRRARAIGEQETQ